MEGPPTGRTSRPYCDEPVPRAAATETEKALQRLTMLTLSALADPESFWSIQCRRELAKALEKSAGKTERK